MKRGITPTSDQVLNRRGFTIVELLIVIVVIGILAAITIVAYNGITQRARIASLSSDLENAAKRLAIDQVTNSSYPVTPAAANNGAGLQASAGTTYQYAVNNSANPQTFCITATNGTTSYYASSTSNVPTAGACAGQGVNGVPPTTNYILNPSMDNSGAGYGGNGYLASLNTSSTGGYSGPNFLRATFNGSAANGGFWYSNAPVAQNQAYVASAWMRASRTIAIYVGFEIGNSSGGNLGGTYSTTMNVGTSWTRVSYSVVMPANADHANIVFYGPTNSGDFLDLDAVMLTQGSTTYNYADGSSPNWIWNGTPNTSTSTGPPL